MIVRPRTRRSRRPIVLGVLIVAVAALWAILRQPANRHRLEVAARDARERFATWRAQDLRPADTHDIATADADATGLEPATADAGSPTDDGAAKHGDEADGVPAFEESNTPA